MPTMLGEGFFLVSFWKPLLLLPPFVGWAWIITRVYDKHAARFFLPRTMWNLIHMIAGLVAVFAALAIPMQGEAAFWIGLGLFLLIRMPDHFKILVEDPAGIRMIMVAVFLQLVGVLLIYKITKVEY